MPWNGSWLDFRLSFARVEFHRCIAALVIAFLLRRWDGVLLDHGPSASRQKRGRAWRSLFCLSSDGLGSQLFPGSLCDLLPSVDLCDMTGSSKASTFVAAFGRWIRSCGIGHVPAPKLIVTERVIWKGAPLPSLGKPPKSEFFVPC